MPSDSQSFDTFAKALPPSLFRTAVAVTGFATHYISSTDNKLAFDWDKFQEGVKGVKDDKLTVESFDQQTIYQESSEFQVMVDKVVEYLVKALGVAVTPAYLTELTEKIKSTFDGKNNESKDNFLWSWKEGSNTTVQYKVQFALPIDGTTDYFYSLVSTLNITAKCDNVEVLWGMINSSSSNYSVYIQAEKLIVVKDFVNPHSR